MRDLSPRGLSISHSRRRADLLKAPSRAHARTPKQSQHQSPKKDRTNSHENEFCNGDATVTIPLHGQGHKNTIGQDFEIVRGSLPKPMMHPSGNIAGESHGSYDSEPAETHPPVAYKGSRPANEITIIVKVNERNGRTIRLARPEDARNWLGQELKILREVGICARFIRDYIDNISQEVEIGEIGAILPLDPTHVLVGFG